MSNHRQFDTYWVQLDPTVGSEIQRTRPAIVISPDVMNKVVNTVVVIPLTTRVTNWPFRTEIKSTGKVSSAACDHIRSISVRRLQKRIGSLADNERKVVLRTLQQMFAD